MALFQTRETAEHFSSPQRECQKKYIKKGPEPFQDFRYRFSLHLSDILVRGFCVVLKVVNRENMKCAEKHQAETPRSLFSQVCTRPCISNYFLHLLLLLLVFCRFIALGRTINRLHMRVVRNLVRIGCFPLELTHVHIYYTKR